jgi:hypothetical protein
MSPRDCPPKRTSHHANFSGVLHGAPIEGPGIEKQAETSDLFPDDFGSLDRLIHDLSLVGLRVFPYAGHMQIRMGENRTCANR